LIVQIIKLAFDVGKCWISRKIIDQNIEIGSIECEIIVVKIVGIIIKTYLHFGCYVGSIHIKSFLETDIQPDLII